MPIFRTKYRLKRKTANELEFEEASPFAGAASDKVFRGSERIDQYARIASFLIFGLIGILLIQTFKLQIIDRKKFLALAEDNRIREVAKAADRGVIYDRGGNILAKNSAIFDLVAVAPEISKDESRLAALAREIALIAGKDEAEILGVLRKARENAFRSELILENINAAQAIAFEINKEKFPGIEVRNNAARIYSDAEYFSQIIGYTGRVSISDLKSEERYEPSDFIGKTGLEYFYEKEMRGVKGVEKAEVNTQGRVISIIDKKNAEAGKNIILSIDGALQKKLQDALIGEIKKIYGLKHKNGGAAAVALDPRTGKILAMVSLPTYDNNIFVNPGAKDDRGAILTDPASPMLNRAISGTYPPGSTIKPIMAAAALSEGIVNEKTVINDEGAITVVYRGTVTYFRGWNLAGLGPMNIISAIAKSSDIYFYTAGGGYGNFIGLGVDKIGKYFKKFNLGEKLGIDLPGETGGLVPGKEWKKTEFGEDWNLGNTYHLSIGQGYLLATPLQVALWTSVFANGGALYVPEIVDKITNGETNNIEQEIPPKVIDNNLADKKYIDIVRRGMREAVLNGTAGSLKEVSVPVAGKTGTAQYTTKEGEKTHSWFTSFAPFDNPEIVLTILIEGGGEGSSTAVPVAKDVLDWYFSGKDSEKN